MISFHYNLSPNPMKVALALEEMGLPFRPHPVDARKGEQFRPEFLAINPNGKVPAIEDGETIVFDSNAILLYLAEKTGMFLGAPSQRGELLSWLMFVATGVSPYSGQCVHFRHFAPEPKAYAVQRYQFEAERHYGVLDQHLAGRAFILGPDYTIVDMAMWGWARLAPFVMGEDVWTKFPEVKRWFDTVNARPAAARAEALKQVHSFKTEWDAEAKAHMFRHLRTG
jgi:GST-like protein